MAIDDTHRFELVSPYKPTGDQPAAIAKILKGVEESKKVQVVLGATGTGKTFTDANYLYHMHELEDMYTRRAEPEMFL